MYDTKHHQRGFISVNMILILIGILLVTGAGQWMWRSALQLGSGCQSLIASWELYELSDMCMALGTGMASLRNELESMVGATEFGDYMDLEDFSGMVARNLASKATGFNAPQLSGMINPSMMSGSNFDFGSASGMEKLKMALTQGSMGNQMLSGGNSGMGLQYLQSSAGMGEYGVLSQLSLGSVYGSGMGGIGQDLTASRHYNSMALDSITKLQSSNTPEAAQLLGSLPASPDKLTQSLKSALGQ